MHELVQCLWHSIHESVRHKMFLIKMLLINSLVVLALTQSTVLRRKNALLSRKRRYLSFPKNSNFVITLSYLKAVMQVQPRGLNVVLECDVPFPLPDDTRWFAKFKRGEHKFGAKHKMHKRDILNRLEESFSQNGLNANACVKRMICEARQYISLKEKSLVRDLLEAVFESFEIDLDSKYQNVCHHTAFSECGISFIGLILGSFD